MAYEGWTDERVARLKQLAKDGLSASVIANQLGGFGHCTDGGRSSVIGKLHRLKLPWCHGRSPISINRTQMARRLTMARKKAAAVREGQRKQSARPRPPTIKSAPLPMPAADDIARVSFAELEPHHCRFIPGDPKQGGKLYCGLKKLEGSSYCEGHHARCHEAKPPLREPRIYTTHHDSANGKSVFGKGRTLTTV